MPTAYCGYSLGVRTEIPRPTMKGWNKTEIEYCCEYHENQDDELSGKKRLPYYIFLWKYGNIEYPNHTDLINEADKDG